MLRTIALNQCLALWSGLLLLGLSLPAQAHNGKTAYAIPLSGITIDGKLDDWPQEMAIYPIEWISPTYWKPAPPDGSADLTASFRAGYDLNANLLYLAIVVQDEDLVIHPEAPNFTNQDLCEVYVVSDGAMLTMYQGMLKQYTQKKAPDRLSSAELQSPMAGPNSGP